MSSLASCQQCSVAIDLVDCPSGLCTGCFRSTGGKPDTTMIVAKAVVRKEGELTNGSTVNYSTSSELGLTLDSRVETPAVVIGARLERLRELGWLGVTRMGQGGMGELYTGFDPGIQRQVVAKFIRPDTISPIMRARFRTEAATLARTTHPNIARLFNYVEGTDPFIVSEFVNGGTLTDRIQAGPLACSEAAQILEGVARAVAAAHAAGVIHRDLKPSNILLEHHEDKWIPKVTDFGMAKDIDALESLTATNALLGTPEYMSPEQANRRKATTDARSDVWGLAATLYATVTGKPPYTRSYFNSPVLTDPLVPPEAHRPNLPRDLSIIIQKGLERHSDDRYQTALEFAEDLQRFLKGEPVKACRRALPIRAYRRARSLPRLAVLSMVLALGCLGALGYLAMIPKTRTESPIVVPTLDEQMTAKMQDLEAGKTISLIGDGEKQIWHRQLVGAPVFTNPPSAGGATSLSCFGMGLVTLTPPLPISKFTLEGEFLDVESINVITVQPAVGMHRFGLLFGIVESTALDADRQKTIATGYELHWNDAELIPGGAQPNIPASAGFSHVTYDTFQPAHGTPMDMGIGGFYFKPSRTSKTLKAIWRKVRLDVSDTEVACFWREDNGDNMVQKFQSSAAQIQKSTDLALEYLRKNNPKNEPLPPYSTRGAIGLCSLQATFAVRNLTVTPRK